MKTIKLSISQLRRLEEEGRLCLTAKDASQTQYGLPATEQIEILLDKPTTVATGAEIRDFFDNGWDMDYYHEADDAKIQIQDDLGKWLLDDAKTYDVSDLGWLCWQGNPSTPEEAGKPGSMTFEEAFLKWRSRK
jgi:hypothetical protein